jgi:hypothetical protein
MPTPSAGYRIGGAKIPSVTTILGRFKDSGALIKWAYRQGREHGSLEALGKEAPNDLYEVTQAAADIGTVAHAMVEARIKGESPNEVLHASGLPVASQNKAISSFEAYESWASMSKLEIVEQEMPLISERYRFGGTPDAIGLVNGKLCLVDWKTSNAVHADYLLQLAAYRALWEENNPDRPLVGGFHLCRFSKEHGDFAHHFYPELDSAWRMFEHLRAAYEFDRELKKRAA